MMGVRPQCWMLARPNRTYGQRPKILPHPLRRIPHFSD